MNHDATDLLARIRSGDGAAENELYALLIGELRELARAQLHRQSSDHTLQPTALVNEAWLRLAKAGGAPAQDRAHFLAVAARAMRSALIDHARRRHAVKRDANGRRLALDGSAHPGLDGALERTLELCQQRGFDPLDLDEALERLARDEPRQARLVELRFFGGLSREDAAEVLGISRATVAREWELARHRLLWDLGLADE